MAFDNAANSVDIPVYIVTAEDGEKIVNAIDTKGDTINMKLETIYKHHESSRNSPEEGLGEHRHRAVRRATACGGDPPLARDGRMDRAAKCGLRRASRCWVASNPMARLPRAACAAGCPF